MKKLLFTLAALCVLCAAQSVKADTLTFVPPDPDIDDLDHHKVYTWKVSNVNLPQGHTITGARLTFKNIANWDSNPNRLFVHMFDNARYSGIRSFTDDADSTNNPGDIVNDFTNTRYHGQSDWLIASGTANTALFERSFSMTPTNFVYDFTEAQFNALFAYIANGGNFAIGFDPDCHFFNDYIKLEIFTAKPPPQIPEPTTMVLLGTGLAGLYARRRRQRSRQSAA